jgi:hypothetical protein
MYPDTFAVVEYHLSDLYNTPWGDERAAFYNLEFVPFFSYDGSGDVGPVSAYWSDFIARQAIPTPVTLQVGATHMFGATYRIALRAHLEPSADPLNLVLYAVLIEDWYPADPTYSRNDFRAATATSNISLAPGECYSEFRSITLDASWNPDHLGIIAWAQHPAVAAPAEVYQAAKDMWPFQPLPGSGDLNCDQRLDFGDINPFVLALTNPASYAALYPDCDIMNADVDGNGSVGFEDINPFIALLTP